MLRDKDEQKEELVKAILEAEEEGGEAPLRAP